MSSLTTQGLVKQFGRAKVVDNVDISVSGGEVVGLLGPNGAGKTTCFYMICGLVRRDQGSAGGAAGAVKQVQAISPFPNLPIAARRRARYVPRASERSPFKIETAQGHP